MEQHISLTLFGGLCSVIGTSEVIAMRRDVADVIEAVEQRVRSSDESMSSMESGSQREGFRLIGSDLDSMKWFNDHRVIWEFSQIQSYNPSRTGIIFADCSKSLPGYALLQFITFINNKDTIEALVVRNGEYYISSSKFRQMALKFFSLIKYSATLHGPCANCFIGPLKYDQAFCFVSDFWPPSASSWIKRCSTWPRPEVVHDIVKHGCHFVAIGHKMGNHEDFEWRISFSLAEQKLVYSMNHCQFLTYGLLKLFLKEVINKGLTDNDKQLCSYHMKTAVFWVIQQNTVSCWCPQNILENFDVCFKHILKWVYNGVCPNFFIPENNMFLNKINGRVQEMLFRRLSELYDRRRQAIVQIPLISWYFTHVIRNNPILLFSTNENFFVSETNFDEELYFEIFNKAASDASDIITSIKYLNTINQLINLPLSQYHVAALQKFSASIFLKLAFLFQSNNKGTNKFSYSVDKFACYMMKLAAKFGFLSDKLLVVAYYYKTSRILEALSVLEKIRVKFAKQSLMYNRSVDEDLYIAAVGGKSWSTKTRESVARDVRLFNGINYLNELIPEQQFSLRNKKLTLLIPPFVLFHMLEIFCYRLVYPKKANNALSTLKNLICENKNFKVPYAILDISYQILGICQQVTGNLEDAFYSYRESLRQHQFNRLKTATLFRMCTILYRLIHERRMS
ncbi:uncharacterized protein LOC134231941 [Saccostrea cucullata]|uniref:uncharacterized protein LOC134231941 n=1 Tax=Saccostrea cuccullata TaxID=36930 RepID=UPI002ED316A1